MPTAEDDLGEMLLACNDGPFSIPDPNNPRGGTIEVWNINGDVDNPDQTDGWATKNDHGFVCSYSSGGGAMCNGTWEIGNWRNTLQLTS